MTGSHFCNPHGLYAPSLQHRRHHADEPGAAGILFHQWATIWLDEHFLQGKIRSGEVYLSNTNRMVRTYQGCDGLKTGYSREAGNGISVTAQRGQTRFLAIVLGAPTVDERYEAAEALLDYGFASYKSVPVVEKGKVLAEVFVDKGQPSRRRSRPKAGCAARGAEEI